MKKSLTYFFIFFIGILVAYLYFKKEISNQDKEQTQIILNEVKNVRKLVVVESSYTQMYNYEKSKYFLVEQLSFNKKVILVVNAQIQISYDLKKINIETDTFHKKVIIHKIPEPEVFVAPKISYYDFEQSTFNTFTKEELNKVNAVAVKKVKEASNIAELKKKAKIQLINELGEIYKTTTLLNWEFVDYSGLGIQSLTFKD